MLEKSIMRQRILKALLTAILVIFYQNTSGPSSSIIVAAQDDPNVLGQIEENAELLFNITYNAYEGLCNACVFASDVSMYLEDAPNCVYEFEG